MFRAFSDERRLRVLELLRQGEQCACVLLQELEISQPTLSYHMKILCRSGIVKERPVGPWKYYSIDAEGCAYAQKLLQALSFGGEKVEIRLIRAELRRGKSGDPPHPCAWAPVPRAQGRGKERRPSGLLLPLRLLKNVLS